MKFIRTIPVLLILTAVITFRAYAQSDCSILEYAAYHYNTSENSHCGEIYEDGEILYGFGEADMRMAQEEMILRIARANAIQNLGQKAAGISNKIKGSILTVTEENEDGLDTVSTEFKMNFNIRLHGVEEVDSLCLENEAGNITCYMLVHMPRKALLETAEKTLKEENEELYQKWISSSSYEELLSQF